MKKIICINCKSTNIDSHINNNVTTCLDCNASEKIKTENIINNKSHIFKYTKLTSWDYQYSTDTCYDDSSSYICKTCNSENTKHEKNSDGEICDNDWGLYEEVLTCNDCGNEERIAGTIDGLGEIIGMNDEFKEFEYSYILDRKKSTDKPCSSCFSCFDNISSRIRNFLETKKIFAFDQTKPLNIIDLPTFPDLSWELLDNLELLDITEGKNKKINNETINQFGPAIGLIEEQTEDLIDAAIKNFSYSIAWVKNPSNLHFLKAIKSEPEIISLLKNKPFFICMEAVSLNGEVIRHIESPSELLKLEAIKQNYKSLKYINEQSEYICLKAIEENGKALKYVKNKTRKLCFKAIQKAPLSLKYVDDQCEHICMLAVKNDGKSLKYVKEQTQELIWAAFKNKNKPAYKEHLKEPSPEIISYIDFIKEQDARSLFSEYSDDIPF